MTYVKKEKKKLGTKNERCASWIMETLNDFHGVITLIELRYLGSCEEEEYSRQDIYNTLTLIEDKIVRGGKGKLAIWYTKEKFDDLGKPSNDTEVYLGANGYSSINDYLKENDFPKRLK